MTGGDIDYGKTFGGLNRSNRMAPFLKIKLLNFKELLFYQRTSSELP